MATPISDEELSHKVTWPGREDAELIEEHWERIAPMIQDRDAYELFQVASKECAIRITERANALGNGNCCRSLLKLHGRCTRVLDLVYGISPPKVAKWLTNVCFNDRTGSDVVDWVMDHFSERHHEPLLAKVARMGGPNFASLLVRRNVDLLAFYADWSFIASGCEVDSLIRLCVLAGYARKLSPRALAKIPNGLQTYREDAGLNELIPLYRSQGEFWLLMELDEPIEPYELALHCSPYQEKADTYAAQRGPEYEAAYHLYRAKSRL